MNKKMVTLAAILISTGFGLTHAAEQKTELQSHAEKALERANEARGEKAKAEGERNRSEAGLGHEGRMSTGKDSSVGASKTEGGVTVNGKKDL